MLEITFSATLVPVALALVQLIKMIPVFAPDWTKPLIAVLVGIGLVWLTDLQPIRQTILEGLLVGLSASGLYSGVKFSGKAIMS